MNEEQVKQIMERRLGFVLDEARSSNPYYDGATVYALRVLSNYYSIGRPWASSKEGKLYNVLMSKEAQILLAKCGTLDDWTDGTVNEHPEPLGQLFKWIVANSDALSTRDIASRLIKYPMITIAKAEDATLRSNGYQSHGDPDERYRVAGIEIITHSEYPKNKFLKRAPKR